MSYEQTDKRYPVYVITVLDNDINPYNDTTDMHVLHFRDDTGVINWAKDYLLKYKQHKSIMITDGSGAVVYILNLYTNKVFDRRKKKRGK